MFRLFLVPLEGSVELIRRIASKAHHDPNQNNDADTSFATAKFPA